MNGESGIPFHQNIFLLLLGLTLKILMATIQSLHFGSARSDGL